MNLSKQTIKSIKKIPGLIIPEENLFSLPEKVLQFGTGVLLRGLPDYFIDKANREGIFNGRIVVVKSTATGGTDNFVSQDSLYTVCIRGLENGKKVDEMIINSSISRVLSAKEEWDAVLQCAHNRQMQIIISNTTEVGISLVREDIQKSVPSSYPGKLLAFLWERYRSFNGDVNSGMVIIPTELIPGNGTLLKSIVNELAQYNHLDKEFVKWLESANHFCNSLVDRIVPGKLLQADKETTERKIGYSDKLMIMAESYRLWAIESFDERVKEILSFRKADKGVVIASDIGVFRELKLRLLNGSHTFSCGLACLAGFSTVKSAMTNSLMAKYIENLMLHEIAPAISNRLPLYQEAYQFASSVLERFRNPYLDHKWLDITLQFSSKMKLRNIPVLLKHFEMTDHTPDHMALGFAAYLLFMKSERNEKGQFVGNWDQNEYLIQDEYAAYFYEKWKRLGADGLVEEVLVDEVFWGTDLSLLKGFPNAVQNGLRSLMKFGVENTLRHLELRKIFV